MNKKGIAFTLVSLLIASTLMTVMFIGDTTPADAYLDSLSLRRGTTDSTITAFTTYFPYHAQKSTKDSLQKISLTANTTKSLYQSGLPDAIEAKALIANCFSHGHFTTPSGSLTNCTPIWDEINTVEAFAEQNTQTNIDLNPKNTRVYQTSPYHLTIRSDLHVDGSDFTASVKRTEQVRTRIPFRGVQSPLYRASTDEPQPRINWHTNLSRWTNKSADRLIDGRRFVHYDEAPNFLQRLSNESATSECCGMTSIVPPKTANNPNNYSNLDYQYFNNECGTNTKRINLTTPSQRSLYLNGSIQASNDTLSGAVLPMDFIQRAQLNDPAILENVTCS